MNFHITTGCRFRFDDDLGLLLRAAGAVLTVEAGTFKLGGVSYALATDSSYAFAPETPDKYSAITGYLVKTKIDGVAAVLVDDVGAGDVTYNFGAPASPFELLCQLFFVAVPADTADLSALDVLVYTLTPQPAPPAPPAPPSVSN